MKLNISLFNHISAPAKMFLLQNLSAMVKAGVSLADALTTLGNQTPNKRMKVVLLDIAATVRAGKTLGEGLDPYQSDFGELFINMVKAGESSGRLEEVLHELYLQIKKEHTLILKVRNAMTYPAIIILAMFGIGIFIVVFVLPNITSLFTELNAELPLATRILIKVTEITQAHGPLLALSFLTFLIVMIAIVRSKQGKRLVHRILLHTPAVGSIIRDINIARSMRSLSSLIKTDIPIVETFLITSRVIGNTAYREALEQSAEALKKGEKLGAVMGRYPRLFPPNVLQMVTVGEETGALDDILDQVASFYEEQVFETMESLPTIIEPVLMVLIGVAVGGIAVAVLMPMYTLTEQI